MKNKKPAVEPGPDEPCNCDPKHRVLTTPRWRAWGGTKAKIKCGQCQKTWPYRAPANGRVF